MNRIKIGFLIDGLGLGDVNMEHPNEGNPGMGGTQYCFLLLAFYLNKFYSNKFDIAIISFTALKVPDGIKNHIISHLKELDGNEINLLLVKTPQQNEIFKNISELKNIKVITWSHNYLYGETALNVLKTSNIKANVFVSKQMYDFYIDNDVLAKSTYIYNIVPDPFNGKKINRNMPAKPILTFMGSLTKEKGFITLLKIWKKISKKYPDATLNIIGRGNLYNRDIKLGPLGIVDNATEKLIRSYITKTNGELDDRIRFLGILGREKYEVFLNSTVGIVNPTSRTETFGLGIVEMAHAKLPVVTKNWNGHPDTAINKKTSLLGFSINSIVNSIDILIQNQSLNKQLGDEAKNQAERFSPEKILPQWKILFENIYSDTCHFKLLNPSVPYWNNYKFIRYINAFLRRTCHCTFLPSIVEYETWLYQIYKNIKAIIRK